VKIFRDQTMTKKLTDQELKDLVASLAVSQKKTDEQMKKTDKKLDKLERSIDKLSKTVGGHTNNVGDVTEEFFYRGLSKKRKLGNIKFDAVRRNVDLAKEYDIMMVNGDSVAVISVKYKLHENDIDKFLNQDLKEFKKYFPEFKNYKIHAGIASKFITEKQEEKIKNSGLFAITQSEKDVEVLNDEKKFKAKTF